MELKQINEILPGLNMSYRLTFLVVGCGGTGGYLVRDLSRIIASFNEQFNLQLSLILIDNDIVESKNLVRQNFVKQDIGKNKAEVLANRYSASYNLKIDYVDEYLPSDLADAKTFFRSLNAGQTFLIGCADNNKTRTVMHELYKDNSYICGYMDSGNEETAGQVVFSMKPQYLQNGLVDFKYERSYTPPYFLPDVCERFDLDLDKHPTEISCAEHAISAPQDITTNIMAATILLNYCAAMIKNISLSYLVQQYDGSDIYSHRLFLYLDAKPIIAPIVFFDTKNNSVKPEYVFDWLSSSDKEKIMTKIKDRNSSFNDVEAGFKSISSWLAETEKERYAKEISVVTLVPQ